MIDFIVTKDIQDYIKAVSAVKDTKDMQHRHGTDTSPHAHMLSNYTTCTDGHRPTNCTLPIVQYTCIHHSSAHSMCSKK